MVRRFKNVSLGTRLFLQARWKLTPYSVMASKLPAKGKILDLGCGHGLLALEMALAEPAREVLALDHDDARVKAAREAAEGVPNLSFDKGSILAPPPEKFAGICAIDVMHYFAPSLQNAILSQLPMMLEPGGVFVMREVDPNAGAVSSWNRLYEKLATASGFTRSSKKGLHFRSTEEWVKQLEISGFEVKTERCSSAIFADILYVCGKRA